MGAGKMPKKGLRFFLCLAALLGTAACTPSKGYEVIDQEEAVYRMKNSQNGFMIVDVRTKEEYDEGHIPSAVLLPIESIKEGDFGPLTDKNQDIFLYCRTGRRAEDAAAVLADAGYEHVYSFGGILEWTGAIVSE